MAKTNVRTDQLRRWKKATKESTFEWLQSALEFARAEKKVRRVKK